MSDKAIRAAKLTAAGILEKARARVAVDRAGGQIAPSKYLPDVPRQVHAAGGYVPTSFAQPPQQLVVARVARPVQQQQGPSTLDSLTQLAELAYGKPPEAKVESPSAATEGHSPEAVATGMSARAQEAMNALLKGWTGQAFDIESAYRDPNQNALAKGAKNSQHLHGNAYDIDTTGWTPEQKLALATEAYNAGFRGFGFYGNNLHFDVGAQRAWGPSYHRESIPDWAQPWTQQYLGYASGGKVAFQSGNHPDVPDVLYHGNALQIARKGWTDEIDHEQTKRNMEGQDFKEFKPSTYGNYGPGIYLTDKPEVASEFAQGIRADRKEPQPFGQVMKLHVSMKQPFTDDVLRHPAWKDYIKQALTQYSIPHGEDRAARDAILKALDNGTATVRDLFLRDTPQGTLVNQHGQHDIHDTIRNSGFDGIIAHRPDGSKEYVAFKPEQVKSALSARKFDPASPDMTYAAGGAIPQKTVKAYKLFRTKGDGKLYPLFVHADKPVPIGEWLEAEEGPQGKTQGKVKSKLGDLAYRPGWHAGDLPIATHIGGKSDPSLKKPDYRPDNHVWAEVEMAADKDWQSVADSRGKGVKAHITDQVPYGGFYRYKTNPNMTGNWLIGGNMKVNRVLPDEEVKAINDAAGTADLPRLTPGFAAGGAAMFEGIHEDLQNEDGTPKDLWHGTPGEPFDEFKDEKIGRRDPGFYGRGHYLTAQRGNAEAYADPEEMQRGSVIGPLHAALKNPFVWDASSPESLHSTMRKLQDFGVMGGKNRLDPWDALKPHEIDQFMKSAVANGHDGVIRKTGRGLSEIVVFKPSAIKHRDAERFDPNDPNIYHARGGVAK